MRTVLLIMSAYMIELTFTQVFKINAVGALYDFVAASYLDLPFIFDRFYESLQSAFAKRGWDRVRFGHRQDDL